MLTEVVEFWALYFWHGHIYLGLLYELENQGWLSEVPYFIKCGQEVACVCDLVAHIQ
jgi:hypothetical protein